MSKPNGLMEAGARPLAGGIELFTSAGATQLPAPVIVQESASHQEAVSTIAELTGIHQELQAIYTRGSRSLKDRVHPIVLQCEIAITDLKRVHGCA